MASFYRLLKGDEKTAEAWREWFAETENLASLEQGHRSPLVLQGIHAISLTAATEYYDPTDILWEFRSKYLLEERKDRDAHISQRRFSWRFKRWYRESKTFTAEESVEYYESSSSRHKNLLELRTALQLSLPAVPAWEDCSPEILTDNIAFITALQKAELDDLFEIKKTTPRPKMPTPNEFRKKYGREPEDKGLELVLVCTHALFKSRKTLTDSAFDSAMKSCKTVLRRTLNCEYVRDIIGASPQHWKDMTEVFVLAIPVLEAQSLAADNSQTGVPASSSALMAANHDTLMKDLERLNDILLIARNVLATTQKVQNLAGESLLDQQVLKLIDLCVRVTARGYDGDAGSRAELHWGNVIGSCKSDYDRILLHRCSSYNAFAGGC